MQTQIRDQVTNFTQQCTTVAAQINQLTLESATQVFNLQVKAFEKASAATTAFWTEAAQVKDPAGFQALWTKGLQVARENTEQLAAAGQEIAGVNMKTGQAVSQLAKQPFEAAVQQGTAAVAKATTGKDGK